MTVSELAQKLNVTVLNIFGIYRQIFVRIPQDENYVLTPELITKARLYHEYQLRIAEEYNVKHKVVPTQLEERREKRVEILNELEPYFYLSETELLNEFMKHNSISSLILDGKFRKATNGNFGFFENIKLREGDIVKYPISNYIVDKVFIPSNSLQSEKRYLFEVTLAKKKERQKHYNPFLLQVKIDTIELIEQLSYLNIEIINQQTKLNNINSFIENTDSYFIEKKTEIDENISKIQIQKTKESKKIIDFYDKAIQNKYVEINDKTLELSNLSNQIKELQNDLLTKTAKVEYDVNQTLIEKQNEANEVIESYNQIIINKYEEIEEKKETLKSLISQVQESNNNLQKMENLISTLTDRVQLCRKLEFISKEDEIKYLNSLSGRDYEHLNHLDFKNDLNLNFSDLAEHIHAYLYFKKNLIYTEFQIKNFLTLLRTHDIIVLSGLSGSGKTQIVKSFAEAVGGVAKIIPVKPNWTSSEDLIGYYNPLQMSFLPTPFTEAIVEAIHNPNQLYFICLDEMNLARVEYYFADFLSKLEERNTEPKIELYASHEEEQFVSEFTTLLNLIENSIAESTIKTWQDFLNDDKARNKFFEMLGNTEKESMLQLHSKMKRRLTDILKFPSIIKIPNNVRFIGAINVDETTHYFSPKILDRIHVVKFENPLLFEEQVNNMFENKEFENELIPVYVNPNLFSKRLEYPKVNISEFSIITQTLKDINQNFLLPLNIDFGIRSIRQSLNYTDLNNSTWDNGGNVFDISLNTIIIQKILPRFIFDGSEIAKNGEEKIKLVEDLKNFLEQEFDEFYYNHDANENEIGKSSSEYLEEMIEQAKRNHSQFNFFA